MSVICILKGVGFILLISLQEPLTSLIELLCLYSNFDILKVTICNIHSLNNCNSFIITQGPKYIFGDRVHRTLELSHSACWDVSSVAEKICVFCSC